MRARTESSPRRHDRANILSAASRKHTTHDVCPRALRSRQRRLHLAEPNAVRVQNIPSRRRISRQGRSEQVMRAWRLYLAEPPSSCGNVEDCEVRCGVAIAPSGTELVLSDEQQRAEHRRARDLRAQHELPEAGRDEACALRVAHFFGGEAAFGSDQDRDR